MPVVPVSGAVAAAAPSVATGASVAESARDPLLTLDRRRVAELVDHQLWNLGLDIIRSGENLLLRYGFARERAPYLGAGSSRYSMGDADGRVLDLWGWGAIWSNDRREGVLLRRHVVMPRMLGGPLPATGLHRAEALPGLVAPRTVEERWRMVRWIGEFATWVVRYERWVRVEAGEAWREEVYGKRPRHVRRQSDIPPSQQLRGWEDVARTFARVPSE